jgi:ABC-type cobalamin/Fe3+-siderophores transport system ATPase subunit
MLRSCEYEGRLLQFAVNAPHQSESNRFTVIVGKNGSGKSRLLRGLVEAFVSVRERSSRAGSLDIVPMSRPTVSVYSESPPNCVIALSTSPFDRFPIGRETEEGQRYRYLGLRGLNSANLSLSFMSRTLSALLGAVTGDRTQATVIGTVLGYLGYESFIEARFVSSLTRSLVDLVVNAADPVGALHEANTRLRNPQDRFLFDVQRLEQEELLTVVDALRRWRSTTQKPRLDLRIDAGGVHTIREGGDFDDSLLTLVKHGFFQLRDIGLQKEASNSLIRIHDASSGEQCVLMALLGIASHIQDGALICIDEPEICLHPEWQERYIELLMTTFSQFTRCHFVIATHSPQVVARLHDTNCFVLDMESGVTTAASALNGRSSDFQLAQVFKTPGFKNEYLTRVLFNALSVIGSGKTLQQDQIEEVTGLLSLKDGLTEGDPVRHLMNLVERTFEEMARA